MVRRDTAGVFEGSMGIGAVVLAAGGSSRLGAPKQLLEFRGETLVRRAAKAALESVCDRVVVVVGSHEMRYEIDDLPVSVVENKNWQSGISSSIRAGLEQISSQDGVVITLCDQPFMTAAVLNELITLTAKHAVRSLLRLTAQLAASQPSLPGSYSTS